MLLCAIAVSTAGCSGSGDSATKAADLPTVLTDAGYTCGKVVPVKPSDFDANRAGVPDRAIRCNRGGSAGTGVYVALWDSGQTNAAFFKDFVDRYCSSGKDASYISGSGWAASAVRSNATHDDTVVDVDALADLADATGGTVKRSAC